MHIANRHRDSILLCPFAYIQKYTIKGGITTIISRHTNNKNTKHTTDDNKMVEVGTKPTLKYFFF